MRDRTYNGDPERTRTPNLFVRSETFSPIELQSHYLVAGAGIEPTFIRLMRPMSIFQNSNPQ